MVHGLIDRLETRCRVYLSNY